MYDEHPVPVEFREHEPVDDEGTAMAQFMTVVLLFGAAVRGATLVEKAGLRECHQMLEDKKPLTDIAHAILNVKGEDWEIPADTMQAIEALHANQED